MQNYESDSFLETMKKKTEKTKKPKEKASANNDYGKNAEQPPEDPDILLMECNDVLQKLQVKFILLTLYKFILSNVLMVG